MKPHKFHRLIAVLVVALAAGLGAVRAARADPLIFNTSDSPFHAGLRNQGWWSATLANTNTDVFAVGRTSTNHVLRNFFTFDLSSLNLEVLDASLELTRFFGAGNATQTLNFFDVSTPAATLNNNVGTSAAIFNDLGTGTNYGTFIVPTVGVSTEILRFSLDAAAVAAINAAAGGFFSIGGSLDPILGGGPQLLFNFSGGQRGVQRLVVNTVPVPSTLLLLGSGLAGLCIDRWRRKK